jgi:cytochrome c biogenesis protein CcmG/thiol:disulfide interchange protein DsbE
MDRGIDTLEQPSDQTPSAAPTRRLSPIVIVVAFALLMAFLVFLGMSLRKVQQASIAVGQNVPPFQLSTFDGASIDTRNMAGKVVVLNFWASWCKPCESEAGALEAAWQVYKPGGKVIFLGADYVDTEPEARAYLKKFNVTYPNGPDLGTKISQIFRIRGVPETYVIDQNGRLANAQIGPFSSLDDIRAVIDPLLK